MEEHTLLVLYDIQIDRVRTKVSEACLDYGLERIQYSAFRGKLTRNKREELWLRLKALLDEFSGKILLQPVCEKDTRSAMAMENEAEEETTQEEHRP